jgi:hypothetical protein
VLLVFQERPPELWSIDKVIITGQTPRRLLLFLKLPLPFRISPRAQGLLAALPRTFPLAADLTWIHYAPSASEGAAANLGTASPPGTMPAAALSQGASLGLLCGKPYRLTNAASGPCWQGQ